MSDDIVAPSAPRYRVEQRADGLHIQVPAARGVGTVLFMLVWLVAWAFGELHAVNRLLQGETGGNLAFLVVWLIGWTAGGAGAMVFLAWQLTGYEVLSLDARCLRHGVRILGFGPTHAYAVQDIQALRVVANPMDGFGRLATPPPPILGANFGTLGFDHGARTVRMGTGLDEAEARQLVALLSARLPAAARA